MSSNEDKILDVTVALIGLVACEARAKTDHAATVAYIGATIETLLDGVLGLLIDGALNPELSDDAHRVKFLLAHILYEKMTIEYERREKNGGRPCS